MGEMFGSKWEKENGSLGGDKFFQWADKFEDMNPSQIRSKFAMLEQKFKRDVSNGKDVWPPTIAYFMALNPKNRIGEDAYKEFKPKLMPHTVDEYKEFGKVGIQKLRDKLQ